MADQPDKPVGGEDWKAYFDAVAGLPARETLVAALRRFEEEGNPENAERGKRNAKRKSGCADTGLPGTNSNTGAGSLCSGSAFTSERFAVDLGCGEGRDVVEMLRRGWRVLAVDAEGEAIRRLRVRAERELGRAPISQSGGPWHERLGTLVGRYEDVAIPACDLVNASFSIPHSEPPDFPGLWAKIAAAVRPGGRFAGQFFGVNDGWAKRDDGVARTYHTRAEVEAMLAAFEVEMLDEVERMGKTAMGEPKYWHVFHVVAKKKR